MSRKSYSRRTKVHSIDYDALHKAVDKDSMIFERKRLASFDAWPHPTLGMKCTPKTLAEAGFFYYPDKENTDSCRCFACGKDMCGWDLAKDVPWDEHRDHGGDVCPFIRRGKIEAELTMQELLTVQFDGFNVQLDKAAGEFKTRHERQLAEFVERLRQGFKTVDAS